MGVAAPVPVQGRCSIESGLGWCSVDTKKIGKLRAEVLVREYCMDREDLSGLESWLRAGRSLSVYVIPRVHRRPPSGHVVSRRTGKVTKFHRGGVR